MHLQQPSISAVVEPAAHDQVDIWSEWLLHHRHADDPQYGEIVDAAVEGYADRVLDGAQLQPGMTLADIGTGEGLVAFRALERVGSALKVILTDVSAAILRYARARAEELKVQEQCQFLECSADNLVGIPDSLVDVVTTRAVLAYVADKSAALTEFYRILKPGGRISLAEPVFQDDSLYAEVLRMQVEAGVAYEDLFLRLLHRWKAAQYPDSQEKRASSPHVNYSERDLLNLVHSAGFTQLHLEFHIDVKQGPIRSWEVFVNSSPHPWAPSLSTILAEQFTESERQLFERVMRPSIEAGSYTVKDQTVYITALKTP